MQQLSFYAKDLETKPPRRYFIWECEDMQGRLKEIEASYATFQHAHVVFYKELDGDNTVLVEALHNDTVKNVREIY